MMLIVFRVALGKAWTKDTTTHVLATYQTELAKVHLPRFSIRVVDMVHRG